MEKPEEASVSQVGAAVSSQGSFCSSVQAHALAQMPGHDGDSYLYLNIQILQLLRVSGDHLLSYHSLVAWMSLEVLGFSLFTCSETRIPCFDNCGLVSFPWVLWAVTLILQT